MKTNDIKLKIIKDINIVYFFVVTHNFLTMAITLCLININIQNIMTCNLGKKN